MEMHCIKVAQWRQARRVLLFLLSLEVLKGMGIVYSVTVNLHIRISWSGFSFDWFKGFSTSSTNLVLWLCGCSLLLC
jgi:hypothetical protein